MPRHHKGRHRATRTHPAMAYTAMFLTTATATCLMWLLITHW